MSFSRATSIERAASIALCSRALSDLTCTGRNQPVRRSTGWWEGLRAYGTAGGRHVGRQDRTARHPREIQTAAAVVSPIRLAAPMAATRLASIAREASVLNFFVWHTGPASGHEHFHTLGCYSKTGWPAICLIATRSRSFS